MKKKLKSYYNSNVFVLDKYLKKAFSCLIAYMIMMPYNIINENFK